MVWSMALAGILALDFAGILYGSKQAASMCITVTVIAPVFIAIAVLVLRLGPDVLAR